MSDLNHKNIRKLAVDVTDDESVAVGIKKVYEETEGIDLLISNAGTNHTGPLLDTPFEEGVKVVETNFFGFVRLVKNVVPRMGTRGKGTVVAIGSILGELATPFQAFYNASKAALHSYTETLRMECHVIGVKVVLIAPGSIKSNISVKGAYTLAHDSFYKGMEKQIKRVHYQSQTKAYGVMDTNEFANTVVRKITSANPPQYLTLGGMVGTWSLLKWLSRTTAEALIWSQNVKEAKPGTYGPM
jgi:short-subunit dehydrogenase